MDINIIIVIIIAVIGIVVGAIILNKNDTTKNTSSSSSDIQQPTSNEPTIIYCSANGDWPKTKAGHDASISCGNGNGNRFRICNEDGTWDEEDPHECDDITVKEIDYKQPETVVCNTIQKDIAAGKTIITIHVQYSFYYKYCKNNGKYVNERIVGIRDFTFTANTNSIAEDYNNVKDTIPSKIFESIKSTIDDVNSKHDCKIDQGDIEYLYPAKLNVFKNNEYLIVVSNYTTEIEVYSYDYPYNYINNSIVTIQSKTLQDIKPTDNILYKVWTNVNNWASEPVCQSSGISNVWGNIITYIYTNKYITFCLILTAMLRNINVSLTSLGDCKATFKFNCGGGADFILSKEPYCKGVYLLTDMKDSLTNICKMINTWNGKGWKYTIDLNAAYSSTPTVYNLASKKDIAVYNTGSNLLNDAKYKYVTNTVNEYIPPVHCNEIKH